MPNWCDNNLYLTHDDPEMIKKAKDAWESGNFLATLVPEPDYKTTPVAKTYPHIAEQFADTEEEKAKARANEPTIREDAWWDWRVQNWGTKWDIGYEKGRGNHAQGGDNDMFVYFDSAWSPPTSAYESLLELGFDIKAFYHEGGMGFCGAWINGEEEYYDIKEYKASWVQKNIPKFIDDEMDISACLELDEEGEE